jgi:ubiquinone/menaquinone biosynthesis C-methylase UbiE
MADGQAPAVNRKKLHAYMRGYTYSSLLRTSIELGVFDALADGPADAATLTDRLGTHPRGTRILLNALAAMELLESDGTRYRLPEGAEDLLVSTGADYFGEPIRLGIGAWEWEAHKWLTDSVRTGGPVLDTDADRPDFDYFGEWAERSAASSFNTGAADLVADLLLPWPPGADRVDVLDVGCGSGTYGYTIARREPRAHITGLDWSEQALAVAEKNAENLGLRDRTSFLRADAFRDPLGGPYDMVAMAHVLHHRSADQAASLLKRLFDVIRPGGRIGVVGHTYEEGVPPARDPNPHMFSVIMLIQTSGGEAHSVATYRRMFADAGFVNLEFHASRTSMHRAMVAERP